MDSTVQKKCVRGSFQVERIVGIERINTEQANTCLP